LKRYVHDVAANRAECQFDVSSGTISGSIMTFPKGTGKDWNIQHLEKNSQPFGTTNGTGIFR
jgi:hypothetical protein